MTHAAVSGDVALQARWSQWIGTILDRWPLPYWLLVLLAGLISAAGQGFEYFFRDPGFQHLSSDTTGALVFVGLVIYMLTHLRILRREAVLELAKLRPSVSVDDATYDLHVSHMLRADRRVELLLLIVSVALSGIVFLAPPQEILTPARSIPGGMAIAAFVVFSYVLLGWLLLTFAYAAVRYAQGLGGLARCQLTVNAFDPTNLLPFGRLGLIYSMAPVGLALIPLIVLGPPKQVGAYLFLGVSLSSFFLLFIPLWGVHRQIAGAKQAILLSVHAHLLEVQKEILGPVGLDGAQLKAITDRATMMSALRKQALDAPSWPFRGSAGTLRAVIVTASPVIYFLLNQLILAYVFPALRK